MEHRYVHQDHLAELSDLDGHITWSRVVSIEAGRDMFDADGEAAAGASKFVDLVTHILVEDPALTPVFGVAVEVFDGGGSTLTYRVWYHGMVEFLGPKIIGKDAVLTPLHKDERLEDLPSWVFNG